MPSVQYTLQQLAEHIHSDYRGDPAYTVQGIATLATATPQHVTFFANPRYRSELPKTQAGIVILTKEDLPDCTTQALITSDPYLGFAKISKLFEPPSPISYGIHPTAVIDPTALLSKAVKIGPGVVIGAHSMIEEEVQIDSGCVIGAHVVMGRSSHLFPRVTLYDNIKIGKHVSIHSGTVIGSDGFGYAKETTQSGFHWVKVPQRGGVQIGDFVEIGANTTIDRGTIEDTILEEGVILDNQIQIAHNVCVGAYTAIAAGAAIAGSTKIGKFCAIGGLSGISGHIEIADHVMIMGSTMVTNSILKPGLYGGPVIAHPISSWRRNALAFQQLSKLLMRVQKLEKGRACPEHSEGGEG